MTQVPFKETMVEISPFKYMERQKIDIFLHHTRINFNFPFYFIHYPQK